MTMTGRDITARRLAMQEIYSDSVANSIKDAVRYMGALQGQDYYGSLWAIGLRTSCTEKEVIAATHSLEIIRTWPQRGTLHFVAAEDARWLVTLSADRLIKGAKRRHEQLELNEAIFMRSKVVITDALSNNTLLTRPEVMQLLEQSGISTLSGRGYHILWYLSQTGVTFIGPMKGKQQTIGLLANLPHHTALTRDESIIELTKRYFTSHGPATVADFMWWAGLTSKDAKAGIEANSQLLTCERIDTKDYWMSKNSVSDETALSRCYLLPGFDEYMLGYKDRGAGLHTDYTQKIVPGGNGMFLPTIVIDGQVVGTWKRVVKKDQVLITLTPFKALTKKDLDGLQNPAEQYGHFVNLPVQVLVE